MIGCRHRRPVVRGRKRGVAACRRGSTTSAGEVWRNLAGNLFIRLLEHGLLHACDHRFGRRHEVVHEFLDPVAGDGIDLELGGVCISHEGGIAKRVLVGSTQRRHSVGRHARRNGILRVGRPLW